MDNHSYNLIKALGEKGEAVEVYEKYRKDAANCKECIDLWQRLKAQEEKEIQEMKQILITHVKAGSIA